MPDELKNYRGNTDWVKIIMALSTAILFVLQGIGFKMHGDTENKVDIIHSNYVPAKNIMPRHDVMKKDDLLFMLKTMQERIEKLEDRKHDTARD